MRWFVRKPDIWGIRPGCAETIWSILTQSPGSVSLFLRIVPGVPFDRHGLRWDIPNTHDMHTGRRSFKFVKLFLILPVLAIWIIAGNGIWFIFSWSFMNSFWSLSRISGCAIWYSWSWVRLGKFDANCSTVTGTFVISGTWLDERNILSTRYSFSSARMILCFTCSSSCDTGPM